MADADISRPQLQVERVMALGIARQTRRMNVSPGGAAPAKLRLALAPKRPSDTPPLPAAVDGPTLGTEKSPGQTGAESKGR
jgi:hypothetical protein